MAFSQPTGAFGDNEEIGSTRSPAIVWAEEDRVFSMTSMPGGRVITGGPSNGDINLYDSRTGTKETTLSGHSENVLALFFVEQTNTLYSAGADSSVRMWNLDTLQNTMVFEGHRGFVVGLHAITPTDDSDTTLAETGLFTGGDDRTIKQWNIQSGACVYTYKGHKGPVNAVCCDPEARYMYSGSSDGLVKVWEIATRRCSRTFEAHTDSVWTIVPLADGKIATGSSDAVIRVWTDVAANPTAVIELYGHRGKVRRLLAMEPILFSGGADGAVNVWNLTTSSLVESLKTHEKQVSSLVLENNQLVSGGFDRLVARWDVADLLVNKQNLVPFTPLSAVRSKELELARQKVDEINALRNKARMKEKTPEEVASSYHELPVNFVCESLENKVQSSRLMCEFFFYVPFLICFVFVFMLRRPIEDNYYLVKGISGQLSGSQLPSFKSGRTFKDITTHEWFSRWQEVMAQKLWQDRDRDGRPIIQGQNLLIGALRMRTQRVDNTSCDWNPDVLRPDANGGKRDLPCFSKLNSFSKTAAKDTYYCRDPYRPCPANAYELLNFLGVNHSDGTLGFKFDADKGDSFAGQLRSYDKGGHYFDLPFNDTLNTALAKMRALAALGFVDDKATRLVDTSFHLYNPALDLFLGVHHIIEIPYGGSYVTVLDRETGYEIFTLAASGPLVFEGFFFLFIWVFVAMFILEMKSEYRKGRMLGFFFSWWNIMEFANLICFIVMYSIRWVWMSQSMDLDLSQLLRSYHYPENLQSSLVLYQIQVWCNAINTILTFLKLLKYVRLNDRLNVLTRTLAAAQQHLMGVIILFVYVVFGFALVGFSIWGSTLHTFRSLSASYVSLLRMLLGDVDYQSMSMESRAATFIFFWAYQTLCLWILLNFLVAVISDAFSDVSQSKSTIPLDVAIIKTFNDVKWECLPRNLRNKLTLLQNRSTQTSVCRGMLEELLQQRDEMVDKDAAARHDYDELEGHFIHRDDFMQLLPAEYHGLQTEDLIEEVWKDMAWEYHYEQLAARGQEQHERERIVEEELTQSLRSLIHALPVVDNISQRLALQHAKLAPFVGDLMASQQQQQAHRSSGFY